ncbi:DUF2167 domain-containing protein [Polaribacter sp. SA4-12]|uniref:DUF2167 domain-containing protein n=1 Tax=Polaribacter sp. SA4-12 TaxID=1312072 RepID=UPI000B3D0E80|nr:DUF2167 domain-containing protein [Polaribacter sp. SA4-12]ARV15762.1 hypothetical protein BTO07_11710 [Polaribacter sp. SA4-12]
MKTTFTLLLSFVLTFTFAQEYSEEYTSEELEVLQQKIDSINNYFTYEYGKISIQDGIAEVDVPDNYKFLNAKQSNYVLTELWGNPPSEVLGLLFPKDTNPLSENFTYAVEVTYSEEGYIEDDDAKDLDYDELLEEMQEGTNADNDERKKLGYPTMDLVGWASKPYYDEAEKKLHWAKEIKFEGEEINTLNYNIRVLGREGYLNLNAIGTIDVLPVFKNDVNEILSSVHFTEGNKYADFNPDIDTVAAYGIGGLIAGKLLAKAGFFVIILKFWKVIALAIVGAFSIFKKKIFRSK